jgi:hypothetical protein
MLKLNMVDDIKIIEVALMKVDKNFEWLIFGS